MARVMMISADSHAAIPPADYGKWLEPKYRDRIPELLEFNRKVEETMFGHVPAGTSSDLVDPRGVLLKGQYQGAWEPAVQIEEMEAEGFVAAVLHPGAIGSLGPYFLNFSPVFPPEYRVAGCWAHNRFLAEFCSYAPDRLFGVAQVDPWPDVGAMVDQIMWARKAGLKILRMPCFAGLNNGPPSLCDPVWDILWQTAVENEMPIAVHLGHNRDQGAEIAEFEKLDLAKNGNPNRSLDGKIPLDPAQRPLWQLIFSGAFDRFPDLKLSFAEIHSEWIAPTLAHLERIFDQIRFGDLGMKAPKLRPTEYWNRNCAVSSMLRPYEVGLRHQIGMRTVMFGSDFPHAEGSWPNTAEWLRLIMAGVPENDVRLMLGENAARFYGFDAARLAGHVERVGPEISEVLSKQPVAPALVENLNWRIGFLDQQYKYNSDAVCSFIENEHQMA